MRPRDFTHGDLVAPAVALDFHGVTYCAADRSGKIAPPLHHLHGSNLDLLSSEALEVPHTAQRPLETRRAHLQPVGVGDGVSDVEGGRQVAAHPLAFFERNAGTGMIPRLIVVAPGAVDEDPQNPPLGFAVEVQLDELEPSPHYVGLGELPELLDFLSHCFDPASFLLLSGV